MESTTVTDTTGKNGLTVTDSIKADANRIYGQDTQVYPA